MQWHRGPTHGPLGIIGLGLVSATLVWVGQRAHDRWRATRDAGPPSTDENYASFGMLVALSMVGTLLHVAMDLPTQHGTRLLSPFDWRWFSIDLMPIVDVYLLAALVAGLLFGRQSPAARQRNAAIVLVLMAANYGLRAVEHSQALATVPQLFGPTLAPPCDPQPPDGWRPIDVWPRQRATTLVDRQTLSRRARGHADVHLAVPLADRGAGIQRLRAARRRFARPAMA